MKILVLILGIHRSGTSLLTNALISAGVAAGNFKDTKDIDNPDGYAEHPEVRNFNDRLLAHLNASWDNWGFRASKIDFEADTFLPWHNEAVGILQSAFQGMGSFVLKDPRIATLLPFWERVVPAAGFQLRRIIILRDPLEVAESQRQRVERGLHDFPVISEQEPMAALWAVTMREVLSALPDDSTLLVSHAEILSHPKITLAAAITFSGISNVAEEVMSRAASRVKHELYRSRWSSAVDPSDGWMATARSLFDDLVCLKTPRILTSAEAKLIVEKQVELAIMMRSLTAVRESISRMTEVQADRLAQIAALERFIWAIAPLTANPTAEQADYILSEAVELAHTEDLNRLSLAVAHTLAQLALNLGRATDAEAILNHVRPKFGKSEIFSNLEKRLLLQQSFDSRK